jgi:hypothetical protein
VVLRAVIPRRVVGATTSPDIDAVPKPVSISSEETVALLSYYGPDAVADAGACPACSQYAIRPHLLDNCAVNIHR